MCRNSVVNVVEIEKESLHDSYDMFTTIWKLGFKMYSKKFYIGLSAEAPVKKVHNR